MLSRVVEKSGLSITERITMIIKVDQGWVCLDEYKNPQGIDQDSGGYPYPAYSAATVKLWFSKEKAENYAKSFKEFTVIRAEIVLSKLEE
jgi:hypothetical protein